jgi:hypothetical protein
MSLTPTQRERLRYLIEDEWVDEDDEERSMRSFRTAICGVESPEELHIFAGNFNWDCGWHELTVVLEDSRCDYGTALMVYWLGQPDYFYRKIELGEPLSSDEIDTWERLKWLEERLLSGGYIRRQIAFEPASVIGRPITGNDAYRPGLRLVPEVLWSPSPGAVVSLEFQED